MCIRDSIKGLYFNGGWCYGGFKATPASGYCYAHLLAKDEPHPVAEDYKLDRFLKGKIIDEKGQALNQIYTKIGNVSNDNPTSRFRPQRFIGICI